VDYTVVVPVKKTEPVKEKSVPNDAKKPEDKSETPAEENA
jgi:hypothetical protein